MMGVVMVIVVVVVVVVVLAKTGSRLKNVMGENGRVSFSPVYW